MMEAINELALFAGAGGGLLAGKLLGWRTVCYVEWNKYAVDVIKARIRDGYLDDAPIWDDCFSFDGSPWAGLVDVITAGFPCQPFSNAGKGLSENDPRNGWPAVKRIIGEVRPAGVYLENVPALISKPYIRRIFGELVSLGYDAEWGTLSAEALGAPHIRERLWIVAYANGFNFNISNLAREKSLQPSWDGKQKPLAHSNKERCQSGRSPLSSEWNQASTMFGNNCKSIVANGWWQAEPGVGRVADGVAHRVDRLAALGNGQVPEVARSAWEMLTERITG